ncbi:Glycosyl transferase family 2 [Ruegeria halocynthiae]|uniref:Glycosyl transferase family 2 n=1 Tax=Ruegeria halocynthiae TaxID=985054 RepID=A0A1H3BHS9_9RHOB|nr:glycosyltransferase family 2 protein [Ruegeria halocynthiae]SDX41532.1 Glycosyl transferase family 2 [Ruegeria halocynthiae]
MGQTEMKVGLFSCARNEGPFILEWVAYHLLVGFDPILIYSNDSTDGTTELLDALDKNRVLSHVLQELKPGEIPQYNAADKAFLHPSLVDADWLMWLDSDEFLYCSGRDNRITDLIARCSELSEGVAVNWLIFGDGNNDKWEPGLVTQRFLRRGETDHHLHCYFKTLFRRSDKIRGFGLHRPHLYPDFRNDGSQFVNTSGVPMHEHMYRSGSRRRHALGAVPEQLSSHDWAAIFHYPVKTRDSFELKRQRGQGTKTIDAPNRSSRFREKYWEKYNQNSVMDNRMLVMADRLQAKVDELLELPEVGSAYSTCLKRYKMSL